MILISPTAYKGTLSPWTAARLMARASKKTYPRTPVTLLPLADGGDGTLEVLQTPLRGVLKKTKVRGPLGRPVVATWALVESKKTAIIEMAEASGLKLVKGKNKILKATTYGSGQLIKAALEAGCRTILIGVGGTATADGGAGALEALGLRYIDSKGKIISGAPQELNRLAKIDWTGLDRRLARTKIYVLCDVKNPLLGKNGSAVMFGPQKGATPSQVKFLEKTLSHWSRFAHVQTKNKPGAGAAGAMAFGLSGFLRARLVDGCEFIIKATKWEAQAKKASLILTGEGKLDVTSFQGKVIGSILRKKKSALVAVVCGRSTLSRKMARQKGLLAIEEMGKKGLRDPKRSLLAATERLLRRREVPRNGADRRL